MISSINVCLSTSEYIFVMFSWQNAKGDDGGDEEEEVLDEETKKKDQIIKGAIDGLMREYAAELNAPSQDEDSQRRKRKKEKKEEVHKPFYELLFIIHHYSVESGHCYFKFFSCFFSYRMTLTQSIWRRTRET